MATIEYKCFKCGEIIFQNGQPERCPKCGSTSVEFFGWDEAHLQEDDDIEVEDDNN